MSTRVASAERPQRLAGHAACLSAGLASVLMLSLLPTPALALQAGVANDTLAITTAASVDNAVVISYDEGVINLPNADADDEFLLDDVEAWTGSCTPDPGDNTKASCDATGVGAISVNLGGGDDSVFIDDAGGDSVPASIDATLRGGTGSDGLHGGDGDDQVFGCTDLASTCSVGGNSATDDGADVFDGGDGKDTAGFPDHTAGIRASIGGGADDGTQCPGPACEGDNVQGSIENLEGSEGPDVLIGSGDPNVFDANGGDDLMEGGLGGDTFNAAGPASGVGNGDTVSYANHPLPVRASVGGPAEDGANCPGPECEGDDVSTSVENITGSPGDDVLLGLSSLIAPGNLHRSVLDGGPGDDVLEGGRGPDVYIGGSSGTVGDEVAFQLHATGVTVDIDGVADDGSPSEDFLGGVGDNLGNDVEIVRGSDFGDTLRGSASADTLLGDLGADILEGLAGQDTLSGEDGDDSLLVRDGQADTVSCGPDNDTVTADAAGVDAFADHPPNCESIDFFVASPPDPPPGDPPPQDPPPAQPADADPPETTLTRVPRNRTQSSRVTYRFTADEQGASFRCRIDGKPFTPCTSPLRIKRLPEGRHRFQVVATDESGNTDPTAASDRFRRIG